MTHRSRLSASLAAVALTLLSVPSFPAAAATVARPVAMTVTAIDPAIPTPDSALRELHITVQLRNTSTSAVDEVRVLAQRGYPIASQAQLDSSLADRTNHTDGQDLAPKHDVELDLAAGASATVTFTTTTSVAGNSGLCLCNDVVYPIDLQAVDGAGTVGWTRTYVPSTFDIRPNRVQVAWVWPLIDRPHRLTGSTVFFDDDLAASVDGGRLDRSLRVLEEVGHSVPVTLVVDPELLDELEIMASGRYTVRPDRARAATAGTGQAAARQWLARLHAVLQGSQLAVELTPAADPDVQRLTTHDLSWSEQLPAVTRQRVNTALSPIAPRSDLAWPAGGAVGRDTLDRLVAAGARTVLLNDVAVSPSTVDGAPASLARLRGADRTVAAALTSPVIQADVAQAVALRRTGATAVPRLLAEIAVREEQEPGRGHAVVLTPPRYVDPNPTAAARLIRITSSTAFSTPAPLDSLSRSGLLPSTLSRLRHVTTGSDGLSDEQLDAMTDMAQLLPAVSLLLSPSRAGRALAAGLSTAQQRLASASWRRDGLGGAQVGHVLSADVLRAVRTVTQGVRIVPPASGNYTLASSSTKVPVTVQNTLSVPVAVRVGLTAVGNQQGFTTKDAGAHTVNPGTKTVFQIVTELQRSGRIQVDAQLGTATGIPVGQPVHLTVHSTVLGTIGVIITVVAAVVLVLALLVRYLRRLQRLRARRTAPRPVTLTPADAATREPVR